MKAFKEIYPNIDLTQFNGKRILITGATGFVGNRLTQVLSSETNAAITCLINNYGNAFKLSRYGVNLIKGNILSVDDVASACTDIDIIIHCAYGNKGTEAEQKDTNIAGTRNLCDAAMTYGVSRFIFLSTVSTYEFPVGEYLDEKGKKTTTDESYAASKLVAEKLIAEYVAKGLKAVILQPTAIYGPWAPSYVLKVFRQMEKYRLPLINNGDGICNAIYIDDLVQAILLASINDKAVGNTYLVNGDEHINWKQYFGYFEKMLGTEATVSLTKEQEAGMLKTTKPFLPLVMLKAITLNSSYLKNNIPSNSAVLNMYRALPISVRMKMRGVKPSASVVSVPTVPQKPILPINGEFVNFHKQKFKVVNNKLKEELQFKPQYSFDAAFQVIDRFYKWFYTK